MENHPRTLSISRVCLYLCPGRESLSAGQEIGLLLHVDTISDFRVNLVFENSDLNVPAASGHFFN